MAVFLQGRGPRRQGGVRLRGQGEEIRGIRRQRAEGKEGVLRNDGAGERPRDDRRAGLRCLFKEIGDRDRHALLQARVRLRRDQGPRRLFRLWERVLRFPLHHTYLQAPQGVRDIGRVGGIHLRAHNQEAREGQEDKNIGQIRLGAGEDEPIERRNAQIPGPIAEGSGAAEEEAREAPENRCIV